jgi:hypothetical protein
MILLTLRPLLPRRTTNPEKIIKSQKTWSKRKWSHTVKWQFGSIGKKSTVLYWGKVPTIFHIRFLWRHYCLLCYPKEMRFTQRKSGGQEALCYRGGLFITGRPLRTSRWWLRTSRMLTSFHIILALRFDWPGYGYYAFRPCRNRRFYLLGGFPPDSTSSDKPGCSWKRL